MNRRSVYLLISLFLLPLCLPAQEGMRLGFRSGYSLSTQYGILEADIPYTVKVFPRHGGAAGLLLYYPITETFGIQQEFLWVQKGSREDIDMIDRPIFTRTEYDLNYLDIPVLMRYRMFRLGSTEIFGSSGFALSILLSGNYRLEGTVEINGEAAAFENKDALDSIDLFDYAFLYGAGMERMLFGHRTFLEYRFSIGWNILAMPTAEGEDPAPLRNQNYLFTLGLYL